MTGSAERIDSSAPALIMGNGPSLKSVDFRHLDGYATFGMNAAYRYWNEIGWWPDFYSCLDSVVGQSHKQEIAALIRQAGTLGIKRFLLRHQIIKSLGRGIPTERIVCYERLLADKRIPKLRDVTTGSHTALWAESLGFRTLLLAGVDCDYVERVEGSSEQGDHLVIESAKPNPNYFFEGYQQPGDRYNIPNAQPNMHIQSWRNVARHLSPGTLVVNLNPGSGVDAFPSNTGSAGFLEPGRVAYVGSLASELIEARTHTYTMAMLRSTIAQYSKYSADTSISAIWHTANAQLNPATSPAAQRWRESFVVQPISLADRGQVDSAKSSSRAYAKILVRRLGDLELNDYDRLDCSTAGLEILINDARSAPQACRLLKMLHQVLATAPFNQRAIACLRRLASFLMAPLPHRVRAIDYRHPLRRLRARANLPSRLE